MALRTSSLLVAGAVLPGWLAIAQAQDAPPPVGEVPAGVEVPLCNFGFSGGRASPTSEVDAVVAADQNDQSLPADEPVLVARCQGRGIILGEADRHSVFTHADTGAMVVEIERLGRVRVMLFQRDEAGQLSVENISGALAVAGGRSPIGDLRGLRTDYAAFARDGEIALASEVADEGIARGSAARQFSLRDFNQMQGEVRRMSAASQGAE